jgi:hypothetical protein
MKITIKELKTLIKSVISEQYGGRYPIFFDFEFNYEGNNFDIAGELYSSEDEKYKKMIVNGEDFLDDFLSWNEKKFKELTGLDLDSFQWVFIEAIEEYADKKRSEYDPY